MMKSKMNQFLLPLAALAFTVLACQAISGPAADAGGLPPTQAEVLYEDNFDDPNSGWLSQRDADGITDYDQGGYRIKVDLSESVFWVESGRTFTDVRIDVDATKLSGPDDNEMGVICRYVDEQNFYIFTISSDGWYGITKLINDEYELVGMTEFKQSDAINQGSASNHLQVVCKGDSLRFHVNGTLLADVTDGSYSSGDIGLIAGTTVDPGTDILFDNLVVVRP